MDMRFLVAWDSPGAAEQQRSETLTIPGVEPGLSRPQRDVLTTRRDGHLRLADLCHNHTNTTHQRCHPAHTALLASHRQSDCAATRPAPHVRTYTHIGRVFCGTSDARPTAWGPRLHASAATARPTMLSSVCPIARASHHPKPLLGGQQEGTRILPPTWKNDHREIRTPNLLIWSQTRCRCAI